MKSKLFIYLRSIYGISVKRSKDICIFIGEDGNSIMRDIALHKLDRLKKVLNYYRQLNSSKSISKNLNKYNKNQISRKIKINSWSGRKLKIGLPCRGQRTRSNATRKNHRIKKAFDNPLSP